MGCASAKENNQILPYMRSNIGQSALPKSQAPSLKQTINKQQLTHHEPTQKSSLYPKIQQPFSKKHVQPPSAVDQLPSAVNQPSSAVNQPPSTLQAQPPSVSNQPHSATQPPSALNQPNHPDVIHPQDIKVDAGGSGLLDKGPKEQDSVIAVSNINARQNLQESRVSVEVRFTELQTQVVVPEKVVGGYEMKQIKQSEEQEQFVHSEGNYFIAAAPHINFQFRIS